MAILSDTRLAPAIVDTIEPLLVLDDSLTVLQANPAFYSLFHTHPDEVQGRNLFELGNRQWDLPELRSLLENVVPTAGRVDGYRVEHEFPVIGHRIMLLNARLIDGADPRPDLILLAISDITELEKARYELEGQKEYSEKIIDSIREALLVLNWDLQVKHANQPFYEAFRSCEPCSRTSCPTKAASTISRLSTTSRALVAARCCSMRAVSII